MRSLLCACVAVAAVSALQPVSRRNGLKHLASGGAALAPLLYPAAAEAAFGKPKALTKKQLAEKEAREKEEAAAAAAAQAAADAESDAEAAAAREREEAAAAAAARADNKGGKGLRRSCASRSQFVRNGECVDRFKGDVPKDAIQRNLGNVAATGDSISGTFSKIGYRRVCDSRSQVLVGGECVGRN
jgi:membrane protein involved in colicin uptake